MSRFPKLTETFILNEIVAVEGQGVRVEIFPLLRENEPVLQPGAAELAARAHYTPFMSPAIAVSQVREMAERPRAYLGALAVTLRETWGSARFFAGAVAYFPKAVHLARLIRASGIEHVHCHFANHPALVGFVIGRLTGLPWSFTAHGSDLHLDKHMLCRKVREAAFVVAISDSNRKVIQASCDGAGDGVVVIHCGVDTQLFHPVERTEGDEATAGGDEGTAGGDETIDGVLRLIAVGTLHEVKGQRHLIEACALLRDRGVDVQCEIIGDGPDEAVLARLIRDLGLGERIRLVGRRERDEVIRRIQASDVLVAPSVPSRDGRREGLPVVIMEAMACGLPVVASRLSGIPELVIDGRTGFLAEPGDAPGIAEALHRLAADPRLRRRLGVEARREVERDFELNASARRLIERIAAESGDVRPSRDLRPDATEAAQPVAREDVRDHDRGSVGGGVAK